MSDDSKRRNSSIKKYGSRLKSFIRSRVSSTEDAEDILQDVWFQFSNLLDLDQIENLSGWLFRVARNRITDLYRKKSPDLVDMSFFDSEEGSMLREIMEDSPEDNLFADIFWEELRSALNELPEKQRQAFELNEFEGIPLREIAEINKENLKTIISRKQYAVKHLRKRLRKLYNDLEN